MMESQVLFIENQKKINFMKNRVFLQSILNLMRWEENSTRHKILHTNHLQWNRQREISILFSVPSSNQKVLRCFFLSAEEESMRRFKRNSAPLRPPYLWWKAIIMHLNSDRPAKEWRERWGYHFFSIIHPVKSIVRDSCLKTWNNWTHFPHFFRLISFLERNFSILLASLLLYISVLPLKGRPPSS